MGTPEVSDRDLLAYAAGELAGEDVARIESYLALHPDARVTVERYRAAREAVREDRSETTPARVVARAKAIHERHRAQPVSWLDRIDAIVARLVFDSRAEPVLTGFRGEQQGFHAVWETEVGEIDLEASPVPGAPGRAPRWQVTGQVTPAAGAPRIDVALARSGRRDAVVQAAADEGGMFTLEAPADRYDLLVRIDGSAVVVPDLVLS